MPRGKGSPTFDGPDSSRRHSLDAATRRAVWAAGTTAALAIAFQTAGKATRDAVFLSVFSPTALPAMTIAAAGASLLMALAAAWWLTRAGPRRLVPAGFVVSGVLLLAEWRLMERAPSLVAVLFYLHYSAFGAMLVSGLWSIVAERFDPRAARREVGRIGGAGTLGAILGGVVAARAGATLDVAVMLPLLAACHLGAAASAAAAGQGLATVTPAADEEPLPTQLTTRLPYLRLLLALVVLTTLGETMLDYVFKARVSESLAGGATAAGRGEHLLQFFAWFYTGTSALAFVVQVFWSRPFLRRLGLARTVGTLPLVTAVGSAWALASGGFVPLVGARAGEAVTRFSLYRSGYELLFAPLLPREKRASKSVLDVGVTRLGDVLGALAVRAMLLVPAATQLLLAFAVVLSGIAAALCFRLQRGYAGALARTLAARAGLLEGMEEDAFQSAMLYTIGGQNGTLELTGLARTEPRAAVTVRATPPEPGVALRSHDVDAVRRALRAGPPTDELVPDVIRLLAWDAVARDAATALGRVAPSAADRLVAALLDPDEEFAVRRRIPSILAGVPTQAVADGLVAALGDSRFEVRYRCGLALHRIRGQQPTLRIDDATVVGAVLREVGVDRGVWESHRVLDRQEDEEWSPMFDEVLRDRASRALQHVFTVLALVLPREPLQLAFRGLHTRDPQVRGTALEYLEVTLPKNVRGALWPFLEDTRAVAPPARSRDEVLRDLLASQATIALDLRRLRRPSDG